MQVVAGPAAHQQLPAPPPTPPAPHSTVPPATSSLFSRSQPGRSSALPSWSSLAEDHGSFAPITSSSRSGSPEAALPLIARRPPPPPTCRLSSRLSRSAFFSCARNLPASSSSSASRAVPPPSLPPSPRPGAAPGSTEGSTFRTPKSRRECNLPSSSATREFASSSSLQPVSSVSRVSDSAHARPCMCWGACVRRAVH